MRLVRGRAAVLAIGLWAMTSCAASRGGAPPASAPVLPVSGAQLREAVRAQDAAVVLVNVWATWCVTCREEFPDLLRLRRELAPRRLAVLFVSGDFASEKPEVDAFLAAQGVDFPTYIKAGGDMEFIDSLHPEWSGALPATFVYGGDGRLLRWWQGSATFATFVERVDDLLPKEAAAP